MWEEPEDDCGVCAAETGPMGAEAGLAGEKEEKVLTPPTFISEANPGKTLTFRSKFKVSNEFILHKFWELFKEHSLWWGLGQGSLQGAF